MQDEDHSQPIISEATVLYISHQSGGSLKSRSRANDFPFSPETEAEFGGLKQNFQ